MDMDKVVIAAMRSVARENSIKYAKWRVFAISVERIPLLSRLVARRAQYWLRRADVVRHEIGRRELALEIRERIESPAVGRAREMADNLSQLRDKWLSHAEYNKNRNFREQEQFCLVMAEGIGMKAERAARRVALLA